MDESSVGPIPSDDEQGQPMTESSKASHQSDPSPASKDTPPPPPSASNRGQGPRRERFPLHWQILIGLIIGGLLGWLSGWLALRRTGWTTEAADVVVERLEYIFYQLVGDLFLSALFVIVIPLITTSIILAVNNIASRSRFGIIGLKTIAYYLSTSTIAILIGLVLVNTIQPGVSSGPEPLLTAEQAERFEGERQDMERRLGLPEGRAEGTAFLNTIRDMVPRNLVVAAATNNILGLIIVSMVVGFFLSRLKGRQGEVLTDFFEAIYSITLSITHVIIRLAPIGVAALIATTIALNYARLAPDDRFIDLLRGILLFSATVVGALLLHFGLVLPLILYFVGGINPFKYYHAMAPALMTAFSTASSAATLPLTMKCVEERAGVSRKTSSFVLPLGATVNMDGTALYECVAAIFIVQAFGYQLDFMQQLFVVVVALLTSIGVAGVPSASLVAILVILQSVGRQLEAQHGVVIPLETGVAILFVFDRFLDMCRTAVNIFSDSCGAAVIARTEGETDLLVAVSPSSKLAS
ncbi:MAG: cation:dicarboxylase symporter family transporter [Phycisphaeraceae bacterium]|nr:cation:dicarboxylase symporter family transporter [Phycisphaeraceae bacterium]